MVAWVVDAVTEREGGRPAAICVTIPVTWGAYRSGLAAAALAREISSPVELITEPEAAARHYETTSPLVAGHAIAVYDLGGGTFDAVILRKDGDGTVRLVGEPTGIADFGGADFDDIVLRHVIARRRPVGRRRSPRDATRARRARVAAPRVRGGQGGPLVRLRGRRSRARRADAHHGAPHARGVRGDGRRRRRAHHRRAGRRIGCRGHDACGSRCDPAHRRVFPHPAHRAAALRAVRPADRHRCGPEGDRRPRRRARTGRPAGRRGRPRDDAASRRESALLGDAARGRRVRRGSRRPRRRGAAPRPPRAATPPSAAGSARLPVTAAIAGGAMVLAGGIVLAGATALGNGVRPEAERRSCSRPTGWASRSSIPRVPPRPSRRVPRRALDAAHRVRAFSEGADEAHEAAERRAPRRRPPAPAPDALGATARPSTIPDADTPRPTPTTPARPHRTTPPADPPSRPDADRPAGRPHARPTRRPTRHPATRQPTRRPTDPPAGPHTHRPAGRPDTHRPAADPTPTRPAARPHTHRPAADRTPSRRPPPTRPRAEPYRRPSPSRRRDRSPRPGRPPPSDLKPKAPPHHDPPLEHDRSRPRGRTRRSSGIVRRAPPSRRSWRRATALRARCWWETRDRASRRRCATFIACWSTASVTRAWCRATP